MSQPLYRHTVREWIAMRTIEEATHEAEDMERQYYWFLRLKQTSRPEHQAYYERECLAARRQLMDASSFVVGFRRRGYELAVADLQVKRTIIDEIQTSDTAVGTSPSLFALPKTQVEVSDGSNPYSTMASR